MRRFGATGLAAPAAALVVLVLLFPAGGNDSDPGVLLRFGHVVPCGFGPEQTQGPGFALAGAVLAAVLVGVGSVAPTGSGAADD